MERTPIEIFNATTSLCLCFFIGRLELDGIHSVAPLFTPYYAMPLPAKIRAELVSYIERTREINEMYEKLGARFSIACRCCKKENPSCRFISTSCGHTFCSNCANGDSCLSCNVSSTFLRIFEQSGSRRCEICFIREPSSRAVLKDCGHVACTICLAQLRLVTDDLRRSIFCPFCRTKLSDEPIQIKEKIIKSMNEPVAKRKMTPEVQLKAVDRKRKAASNILEEEIAKRSQEAKNQNDIELSTKGIKM